MGGVPTLFELMESHPSLNVAQHAAWVLGTVVKNHPPLQINVRDVRFRGTLFPTLTLITLVLSVSLHFLPSR